MAFEPVGSKVRATFPIDQLHIDLNGVAGVSHAAFKNITHPKFVADLVRAKALAFVSESGRGRDHETP